MFMTGWFFGYITKKEKSWIDVKDELPEVNTVVDLVYADFYSFRGDQDGKDKIYGVLWNGASWCSEPGFPLPVKVLYWKNVDVPK